MAGMPRVEQVWFRGNHGDVGGQLNGLEAAWPLANISLVWMLDRATECGLPLPEGWRDRFPFDAHAPSTGGWRGWAKIFLLCRPRQPLADPSERVHESAAVDDATTGIRLLGAFKRLPIDVGRAPRVFETRSRQDRVRDISMMMQVVDPVAYSLPSSTQRISPLATPVERPECSMVPIASISTPIGIARVMLILYSSVV